MKIKSFPHLTQVALLALASAAMSTPLLAQSMDGTQATANLFDVVQLSASGEVYAPQDWLTVTLETSKTGDDPAAVQKEVSKAVEAALAVLKSAAQSGNMEVHSGAFGIRRQYVEGKPKDWIGTAQLIVEGRDFARISSYAAKVPPLTISNMQFSLSKEAYAPLEAQAQKLAIERFRAKASEISRTFGYSSYKLLNVSVSGDNTMREMAQPDVMGFALAEKSAPAEAGKSTVLITVTGTVQLK